MKNLILIGGFLLLFSHSAMAQFVWAPLDDVAEDTTYFGTDLFYTNGEESYMNLSNSENSIDEGGSLYIDYRIDAAESWGGYITRQHKRSYEVYGDDAPYDLSEGKFVSFWYKVDYQPDKTQSGTINFEFKINEQTSIDTGIDIFYKQFGNVIDRPAGEWTQVIIPLEQSNDGFELQFGDGDGLLQLDKITGFEFAITYMTNGNISDPPYATGGILVDNIEILTEKTYPQKPISDIQFVSEIDLNYGYDASRYSWDYQTGGDFLDTYSEPSDTLTISGVVFEAPKQESGSVTFFTGNRYRFILFDESSLFNEGSVGEWSFITVVGSDTTQPFINPLGNLQRGDIVSLVGYVSEYRGNTQFHVINEENNVSITGYSEFVESWPSYFDINISDLNSGEYEKGVTYYRQLTYSEKFESAPVRLTNLLSVDQVDAFESLVRDEFGNEMLIDDQSQYWYDVYGSDYTNPILPVGIPNAEIIGYLLSSDNYGNWSVNPLNEEYVSFEDLIKVTFQVNTAGIPDTLSSASFIQVRGGTSPLTWDSESPIYATNVGGDYWKAVAYFEPFQEIQYKYVTETNGYDDLMAWEADVSGDEGDNNRILYLQDRDTTLSLVWANGWNKNPENETDVPYDQNDSTFVVWLRVNLEGLIGFNPNLYKVGVRGAFTDGSYPERLNWDYSTFLESESNHANDFATAYPGKNFWSGPVYIKNEDAGKTLQYKYIIHLMSDEPDVSWDDLVDNRNQFEFPVEFSVDLSGNDTTIYWNYYAGLSPDNPDYLQNPDNFNSVVFQNYQTIVAEDDNPVNLDANPAALSDFTDAITVEAWIFISDYPEINEFRNIVARPSSIGDLEFPFAAYQLQLVNFGSGAAVEFKVTGGTEGDFVQNSVVTGSTLEEGQWYHVAGVLDGSEIRIYLNGSLDASYTGSYFDIDLGSFGLRIGALSNRNHFFGLIDEVRLWNWALDEETIANQYNQLLSGTEEGLVGYWPMDESYQMEGNGLMVTPDLTSNLNDLVFLPSDVNLTALLSPYNYGTSIAQIGTEVSVQANFGPIYHEVFNYGATFYELQENGAPVVDGSNISWLDKYINGPLWGGWQQWGDLPYEYLLFEDDYSGPYPLFAGTFYLERYEFETHFPFKFSVGGGDNESGFGLDHIAVIDARATNVSIYAQFGSEEPDRYPHWDFERGIPIYRTSALFNNFQSSIRVLDDYPQNEDANPAALSDLDSTFTVETWIFPISKPLPGKYDELVMRPGSFNLASYNDGETTRLFFRIYNTENVPHEAMGPEYELGQWIHLAGRFDGEWVSFFVDGDSVASVPFSGSFNKGESGFFIGSSLDTETGFGGLIEEVRLWDVSRSLVDLTTTLSSTLYGDEENLIGYWPLDFFATSQFTGLWTTPDLTSNHNDLNVHVETQLVNFSFYDEVILPVTTISLTNRNAVENSPFQSVVLTNGWPQATIEIENLPVGATFDGSRIDWIPDGTSSDVNGILVSADNGFDLIQFSTILYVDRDSNTVASITNPPLSTGFSSNGALGDNGSGFVLNDLNGLYVATPIFAATKNEDLYVSGQLYNSEFLVVESAKEQIPRYKGFDIEYTGKFNDSRAYEEEEGEPMNIEVAYRITAKTEDIDNQYVIYEYTITNQSDYDYTDFYAGLAMDWDIGSPSNNSSGYDEYLDLLYVYEPESQDNPQYYGSILLNHWSSGASTFFAGEEYENNDAYFYRVNDYSVVDFTGYDIRVQHSTGPFVLNSGESITVVFALLAAENLENLTEVAIQAYNTYDFAVPQTEYVGLNPGWNLISWNTEALSSTASNILSPLENDLVVALGFENEGLTYDPDVPSEMNTLVDMDHLSGYWLKMNTFGSLSFDAYRLSENIPIQLSSGYNLVSYLPTYPLSVSEALSGLGDNLELVLGFDQGGLTYDPSIPSEFNTLTEMFPDKGYWIKVSEPATLIYGESEQVLVKQNRQILAMKEKPSTFKKQTSTTVSPTNQWISLYAKDLSINQELLPEGTIVKAIDMNGVVCGEYVVTNKGSFGLMPVYLDDPATEIDEGANPGETILIYADDQLLTDQLTWTRFGDVIDVNRKITEVGSLAEIPTDFNLKQNFPNPFNPETTIQFALPKASFVTISVYSITGEKVATLVNKDMTAGYHQVNWDGKTQNGVSASSGVYLYSISSGSYSKTLKMILLK